MTRFVVFTLSFLMVVFFAGCSDKGVNSDLSPASLNQNQMEAPDNFDGPPTSHYEATLLPKLSETPAHGNASFNYNDDFTELSFFLEVYDLDKIQEAFIYYDTGHDLLPVARLVEYNDETDPFDSDVQYISTEGVITGADLIGFLQDHSLTDLWDGMQRGFTQVIIHTTRYPEPPGEIGGKIVPDDN